MKTFIKKLKHTNKVFFTLFLISIILYLIGYITFFINISHLTGIETLFRFIILFLFIIWFIFWVIYGLVKLFTKKYSSFIVLLIFTLLFSFLFYFGSYFIEIIYNQIDNISKDTVLYKTNLITLKDTEFNSDSTIGIINDTTNIEGNVLAKKLLEEEKLDNKIKQYDDFYIMLDDLYNGTIDACFVSSNYVVLFGNEEKYANIGQDTKVIYSYEEEMANQDNISFTNKKLTEPFSILVMGVDSESDGLNANQAFNGDTLMLVTFNPNTLTASMFSIPRDSYVPISCRNDRLAKINSSAAYGTSCVINTVQDLTGINIDYYVKINFKGVVDLVDALGGITVNVEEPDFNTNNGIDYHGQVCEQNSDRLFGNKIVCMDPGIQRLNGEQALAYSRNRHQYLGSDLDRIRHQQDVVSAIAEEAKNLNTFDEFKNILNAVQKNIDTNMTTEQILSLYTVAKSVLMQALSQQEINLSINKAYLETYSLPVYLGSSTTSALGYYKSSLDEITKMMRVNLELEEPEVNKKFNIDANEEYTTRLYGQGLRSGKSVETMPNLIGKSIEEAKTWASNNGINLSVVETFPGDEHFNNLYSTDVVADQSIHINTVISKGTNLTIYVNAVNAPKEEVIESTEEEIIEDNKENNEEENKNIIDNILDGIF